MTPIKSIKLRCKDCQPEKADRTDELCINCVLKDDSLTNLKKIKKYCKWCCNGYNPLIYCNSPECTLFKYRIGKNYKMHIAQINNKNLKKTYQLQGVF